MMPFEFKSLQHCQACKTLTSTIEKNLSSHDITKKDWTFAINTGAPFLCPVKFKNPASSNN